MTMYRRRGCPSAPGIAMALACSGLASSATDGIAAEPVALSEGLAEDGRRESSPSAASSHSLLSRSPISWRRSFSTSRCSSRRCSSRLAASSFSCGTPQHPNHPQIFFLKTSKCCSSQLSASSLGRGTPTPTDNASHRKATEHGIHQTPAGHTAGAAMSRLESFEPRGVLQRGEKSWWDSCEKDCGALTGEFFGTSRVHDLQEVFCGVSTREF